MLGTTLWLIVAIGLLAAALLDAAAAFGRARRERGCRSRGRGGDAGCGGGLSERAAIGDRAPARRRANPLQRNRTPPIRTADRGAGALQPGVRGDADDPDRAGVQPRAATAQNGPDTIAWLQCNGYVAESRVSLRVMVRVLDASGATLAQREQFVTLRLFAEPPYSAVVGRKDAAAGDPASADALAAPAHEGDLGGDTLSGRPPRPHRVRGRRAAR